MTVNQDRGSVLVWLIRDVTKERQALAIPNGLGTWRRAVHNAQFSKIQVNHHDVILERKLLTISQLSTAYTGAYLPVTFSYRPSNSLARTQLEKVVVFPSIGVDATDVAVEHHESFVGVGGFIMANHCDNCDRSVNEELKSLMRDTNFVLIIP